MVSSERVALIDFMTLGNPKAIAMYIANTPKIQEDILEHNDLSDISELVTNLKRGGIAQEKAMNFLGEYLDRRAGKMPVTNLPRAVADQARKDDMKENLSNVIPSLIKGFKSSGKEIGIGMLTHFTVAVTDSYAGFMSAIGMKESHRQITLAGVFAVTMASISSGANASVSQNDISAGLNDIDHGYTDLSSPVEIVIKGGKAVMVYTDKYDLSPYLMEKMKTSPKAQQYMEWIMDASAKNGIDPVLFANQMFRESNHFNPKYIYGPDKSSAGAMGLAQITKGTGKAYGLKETEDFFDPKKSIYAAARIMRDLKEQYNNDQMLAAGAYNGGKGAVEFVMKELGTRDITGEQFLNFLTERYEELGVSSKAAWHVETRGYVADIFGEDWDQKYKNWAEKIQGDDPLAFIQGILSPSPSTAVAAANQMAMTPNG